MVRGRPRSGPISESPSPVQRWLGSVPRLVSSMALGFAFTAASAVAFVLITPTLAGSVAIAGAAFVPAWLMIGTYFQLARVDRDMTEEERQAMVVPYLPSIIDAAADRVDRFPRLAAVSAVAAFALLAQLVVQVIASGVTPARLTMGAVCVAALALTIAAVVRRRAGEPGDA